MVKMVFSNDSRSLPRSPPDGWVYDNLKLADKSFPNASWRFGTCLMR